MPSAPKPATDLREHHVLALRTRIGVPCTGRESIQHLLHNEICMHATAHASAGKLNSTKTVPHTSSGVPHSMCSGVPVTWPVLSLCEKSLVGFLHHWRILATVTNV
ncbi:hypothetical protein PMIN03_004086 [Paraphaeosphaeria minitans]